MEIKDILLYLKQFSSKQGKVWKQRDGKGRNTSLSLHEK